MTQDQNDPYAHELAKRAALAEWREEKKRKAGEAERARKQAELESHLKGRADAWIATTGSTDGLGEQLPRWREQYMDAREAEIQAERQAKLDRLIAEHYDR